MQPEALYKAARVLEELHHDKAEDLMNRLINEYPESDYARKALSR